MQLWLCVRCACVTLLSCLMHHVLCPRASADHYRPLLQGEPLDLHRFGDLVKGSSVAGLPPQAAADPDAVRGSQQPTPRHAVLGSSTARARSQRARDIGVLHGRTPFPP